MEILKSLAISVESLNDSINLYRNQTKDSETRLINSNHLDSLCLDDIRQIKLSIESYNDIIKDGPSPTEKSEERTIRHLRAFLDKFKLRVDERVFENLDDTIFVEVYSKNHKQIFRSVNFFDYCSYSISKLTFTPWNQLYYRAPENTKALLDEANHVINFDIPFRKAEAKEHFFTELETNKKFRYKLRYCCGVFDKLEPLPSIGYLTIISAKETNTKMQLVH